MPLPDGTNAEREDPEPPVNWTSASDLKGAKIYGSIDSPPCLKIRLNLIFNGVEHSMVKHSAGKPVKPGGSYTKIPVFVAGDRTINDSYVILKNIAPALYGSFDTEWQEKITFKFQPSLEAEVLGDGPDFVKVGNAAGYGPKCILCCVQGYFSRKIKDTILSKNPDLPPSLDIGKEFAEAIGQKPFFAGDSPGQVDISYFATAAFFMYCKSEKTKDHIVNAGLKDWWNRMCEKMPYAEALGKPGVDLRMS